MKRLQLPVIILALVILPLIILSFSFRTTFNEMKAQDVFPKKVTMYSANNRDKLNISNINNKYKVIFYLKSSDEYCLEELHSIYNILKLYDDMQISYILLWEDKIPIEQVLEAGIDMEMNYSLKNKASLCKYIPSALVLDENNIVLNIENSEYITLTKQLHELNGNADLTNKVYNMLFNEAFNNTSKYDPNKKTLVMFLNSGCKFCSDGESISKNNSLQLSNKFNVITVRSASEETQLYDVNNVKDYSLIYFNVFDQVFKAGKQPLYIIIDNNGNVTDIFKEAHDFLDYVNEL